MTKQRIVLVCGLAAFALCGLFPPWLGVTSEGLTRSAGYGFILSPADTQNWGIRLDISRLAVEWLCIGAIAGVVWFVVEQVCRHDNRFKLTDEHLHFLTWTVVILAAVAILYALLL